MCAGVTLVAFLTLCAGRSGITLVALGSLCAGVTLVAFLTLCAGRSGITLVAFGSLCAGISLVTFLTLCAGCTGITLRSLCAGITLGSLFALRAGCSGVAFGSLRAGVALVALGTFDGFEPFLVREDRVSARLGVSDVSLVHLTLFGFGRVVTASGKRNAHCHGESDRSQTFHKLFHSTSSKKVF